MDAKKIKFLNKKGKIMRRNVLSKVLGAVLLGSFIAASSAVADTSAPVQNPIVGIYADNFLD